MRYIVVHEPETNSFKLHVWQEDISHMEYIAVAAGINGNISEKKPEEKKPFIELLSRISSWGVIHASPSRGWYLEGAETSEKYKSRFEQDCSLVLKHMDMTYGFPIMPINLRPNAIAQKAIAHQGLIRKKVFLNTPKEY